MIPFLVFVSVGFLSAAEETRHILKILRSHKAAFVKKRQVMNRVFGDYRLKMAEERKRTEKAGEAGAIPKVYRTIWFPLMWCPGVSKWPFLRLLVQSFP